MTEKLLEQCLNHGIQGVLNFAFSTSSSCCFSNCNFSILSTAISSLSLLIGSSVLTTIEVVLLETVLVEVSRIDAFALQELSTRSLWGKIVNSKWRR